MSSTVPATRSLTNTPPTSPCLSSIIRRESTSKSCKSSTTSTPTSCSFMKPPTYPTDSGLSLTNSNQSTSASSFSSFNSSTSAAFAINEDTDSQSINTFNSFTSINNNSTLGKLKNMITRKRSKSLSSMFSSSFSSNNSTRDSSIVSIDITTATSNRHELTETNNISNKPNLFKIEETQSLSQTAKYKQSSINQRDKVAAAEEEEEEEEMFENIANDILTKINMEHDYNEDYDVCYSHTPAVRKMSTNETSGGIEWKI